MKRTAPKADEYLFGSTRIRVFEAGLIGKEKLERLLLAEDSERCIRLLAEYGVKIIIDPVSGSFLREQTLENRLQQAYNEVLAFSDQAEFLLLWRYPAFCNNIKAAIKCAYRGVDCSDMLFEMDGFSKQELIQMAAENRFDSLPAPFANAAQEAASAVRETANPQWVDLILDRACYAAMLQGALRSGVALAVRLVKTKIDLTNLQICVRLLRMSNQASGAALLQDALIEGGNLSREMLIEQYALGEEALWEKLSNGEYRLLSDAVTAGDGSLRAIEIALDNEWMKLILEAKMIPFGQEPLIGYLLASEYEVRNLRILLCGMEAKLPVATIRERMRQSYV